MEDGLPLISHLHGRHEFELSHIPHGEAAEEVDPLQIPDFMGIALHYLPTPRKCPPWVSQEFTFLNSENGNLFWERGHCYKIKALASLSRPLPRNPMGESKRPTLRVHFNRRLRLVFYGGGMTSDAGLRACRELDEAQGLTEEKKGKCFFLIS